MSNLKVPADPVAGEPPHPGLQMTVFPASSQGTEVALWCLLRRAPTPSPSHLTEAPPNTITSEA